MNQARPPKIVLWGKLAPLYPGQKYFGNPRREAIEAAIVQVAKVAGADTFDAQTPLDGHPEWFPDHIHPGKAGYETLAKAVAAHLRGIGLPIAGPAKETP
jgi:lysophospholipase L1-like esterase